MATFYNVPIRALSDVAATFVTSTSDSTIVLSILCANTTASNTDVTVDLLSAADAVNARIASTITVPADSNVDILGNKFILPSGQKLKFGTSNSGSLDVAVSYVEV